MASLAETWKSNFHKKSYENLEVTSINKNKDLKDASLQAVQ